jgi:hypothetical protein
VQIFDDFLNPKNANSVESLLCSPDFEWFFLSFGTCPSEHLNMKPEYAVHDRPQFSHAFYTGNVVNSSHYRHVKCIVESLEQKTGKSFFDKMYRLKSNLLLKDENFGKNDHHFPHTDISDGMSLIYYVNDSDGDTFLFNEKDISDTLTLSHRISPKWNRAILFDSSKLHASSSPKISKYRLVVNIVFKNYGEV